MRRTASEIEDFNKSIINALPKAKTKAMHISAIAEAIGHNGSKAQLAASLVKLRNDGKVLTHGEKAKMVYYRK